MNIQSGIKMANELVKDNEKILKESQICISKEKERIKIIYYYFYEFIRLLVLLKENQQNFARTCLLTFHV